jgi:hypothetical protein
MSNYFNPATATIALTNVTSRSDVQDLITAAHRATITAINAADLVGADADVITSLYDAAIALNKALNRNRDI